MTAKDEIAPLKRRIKARTANMTEAKVVERLNKSAAMYADFMRKYGPQHEGYARWAEGLDRMRKRAANPTYIALSLAKAQAQNEIDKLSIKVIRLDAVV